VANTFRQLLIPKPAPTLRSAQLLLLLHVAAVAVAVATFLHLLGLLYSQFLPKPAATFYPFFSLFPLRCNYFKQFPARALSC